MEVELTCVWRGEECNVRLVDDVNEEEVLEELESGKYAGLDENTC